MQRSPWRCRPQGGDAGTVGGVVHHQPRRSSGCIALCGGHRPVLEHPPHGLPDRLRRQRRCLWLTWDDAPLARPPKTQKRIEQGKLPALDADKVQANGGVLENGLRKILSKIGISLLASYHGAQIFGPSASALM